MESLIKEMFYGGFRLKPDNETRSRLQELNILMERHEKDLKEKLGADGKEIFEKYLDCANEMSSISGCSDFIAGFRLGGRIVMEMVLGEDTSELQD